MTETDSDTLELFEEPDQDLLDGAASLAADPGRWPRQMAELTDLMCDEIERAGQVAPREARRLAGRLMARIAVEFGGSALYLPKADALDRILRDARIWADFDGTVDGPHGVKVLARREGITTIHCYRILAVQRGLHRRSVQRDLFEAGR